MPVAERRTQRRFKMKLPMKVTWATSNTSGEAATESNDVSSRGVYFFSSKDVKQGTPVELLMTLPHEITLAGPVKVRCLGRVARTEAREGGKIGVVVEIERYEFMRGSKSAA